MFFGKGFGSRGVRTLCALLAFSAVRATGLAQIAPGTYSAGVSSSLASPDTRADAAAERENRSRIVISPTQHQHVDLYDGPVRPFSAVAFGLEAGTLGLGVEFGTPLSRSFNLRAGTEFLNFRDGFAVDAAQYQSQARLRSGHVGVDFHPLGGSFRISPQLLIFESAFSASVSVTGGRAFQLGNSSYLSSATDPVHGGASIAMGRHVMPALTIGWGNMLARHSRRWSVPFEFGVAYTGHYTLDLNLSGTACLNYINCMSTSSPQVQQSMHEEEADLNETMKHFQIYPIVKTGFAYRF